MLDTNAIHSMTAAHLDTKRGTAPALSTNPDVGDVVYTLARAGTKAVRHVCSHGRFHKTELGDRVSHRVSGRRSGGIRAFEIVAITDHDGTEGDIGAAETPGRIYVAK